MQPRRRRCTWSSPLWNQPTATCACKWARLRRRPRRRRCGAGATAGWPVPATRRTAGQPLVCARSPGARAMGRLLRACQRAHAPARGPAHQALRLLQAAPARWACRAAWSQAARGRPGRRLGCWTGAGLAVSPRRLARQRHAARPGRSHMSPTRRALVSRSGAGRSALPRQPHAERVRPRRQGPLRQARVRTARWAAALLRGPPTHQLCSLQRPASRASGHLAPPLVGVAHMGPRRGQQGLRRGRRPGAWQELRSMHMRTARSSQPRARRARAPAAAPAAALQPQGALAGTCGASRGRS